MAYSKLPFHRRILPWLFFVIFLALAPVLIFYTAGYRYNPKKGILERNGTLIIDSTPKGAAVFIDEQDTKETTPVTFQNIAPAAHHIQIIKPGYHIWNKTLDVAAEQVSFANTIWLWRADQSTLVLPGMFLRATADPLHQKLAVIESTSTGPLLAYWSPSSGLVGASPIPNSSSNQFRIDWQSEGNALLINELNPAGKIWWSKLDAGQPFVDVLPQASYYWSENILRGSDSSFLYQIDPATRKFLQTQKSLGIVDATKNLTLQTTSTGILLKERSLSTRLFALPSGQWNFGDLEQFYILLHDHDHWLAMDTASPPYAEQLTGDHPRWLMGSEPLSALFVNDGEVWMWQMGKTPALLWRQSEPIQEVDWHRSGTSVFIADQHHLFALELDDRNGRQITQLADFDQIRDFGLIGKSLFIAGTKNGISGLWKIEIE